jgi:hypothetical protein
VPWSDIYSDAARRVVRRQRVQADTRVIANAEADRIRVILDRVAVEGLRSWKQRQGCERAVWENRYRDEGWVFTYEDGRLCTPTPSPRRYGSSWPEAASPT